MNLAILSDIHGNLHALKAVLADLNKFSITGVLLLGDLIDYGMFSNEVIALLQELPYPIICNLWGNHEEAILNDHYDRFSSSRGQESAKFIKSTLTAESVNFLNNIPARNGYREFALADKNCLAIHGSLMDPFWKAISHNSPMDGYEKYDLVFSGHSHVPHFFEHFFPCENPLFRNKKKCLFINPGSVGQPRNHNNCAQYAIFDPESENLTFRKVSYDIAAAQAAYSDQIDPFYKERLTLGV